MPTPLELAQSYMDIVYGGRDLEALRPLLAETFFFRGPFLQCDSAEAYIAALRDDPPRDFAYEWIHASQTENAACLVYWFQKPGLRVPMAQLFETGGGKITGIRLIFDSRAFG